MGKVIAYVRVSTDAQAGEDKFGLKARKQRIIEYCNAHGMEIFSWVIDKGESGAKYRKNFDEIVYGSVENPPIEAVVVAKSDRVARDIKIYFYYEGALLRKGIKLISVTEDFGEMGIFANLLKSFTLVCAEMERENITKRTQAGRMVKSKQGGYAGGKAPYGYKVVDGKLVIEESEVDIVYTVMYMMCYLGTSLRECQAALKKQGLKTRSGGDTFDISTIRRIVSGKQMYQGCYKYADSVWVKGRHEALIPDDEYFADFFYEKEMFRKCPMAKSKRNTPTLDGMTEYQKNNFREIIRQNNEEKKARRLAEKRLEDYRNGIMDAPNTEFGTPLFGVFDTSESED